MGVWGVGGAVIAVIGDCARWLFLDQFEVPGGIKRKE
jgi:hypothetical protein